MREGMSRLGCAAFLLLAAAARAGDAPVALVGSMVTAAPGDAVVIAVTLQTSAAVTGAQTDLLVPPPAAIVARADGRPSCRVLDRFRFGHALAFEPVGCDPLQDCLGVRVLLLGLDTKPLADGSVLFDCDVRLRADAPPGDITLSLARVGASNAAGEPVLAEGRAARISVVAPTPTPTETMLPSVTPSATAVPSPAADDDGGCAVTPGGSTAAWWSLLPLAAAVLRSRITRGRRSR